MPYRQIPIVQGEIYHIYNRSVARQPIFQSKHDYLRALKLIEYYIYKNPRLRFSHYKRLAIPQKEEFLKGLKKTSKLVIIYSFCLMPNHFHFLIREVHPGGISKFMSNFQNSYAKYFNTKNQRVGSLFQLMFKTKWIETDEQLLHLSRYIHLNPYSSHVIKTIDELESFVWSSYPTYLDKLNYDFIGTELILEFFNSKEEYEKFVLNQADYQKTLDEIKHLIIE